jgi:hypothetical protein
MQVLCVHILSIVYRTKLTLMLIFSVYLLRVTLWVIYQVSWMINRWLCRSLHKNRYYDFLALFYTLTELLQLSTHFYGANVRADIIKCALRKLLRFSNCALCLNFDIVDYRSTVMFKKFWPKVDRYPISFPILPLFFAFFPFSLRRQALHQEEMRILWLGMMKYVNDFDFPFA